MTLGTPMAAQTLPLHLHVFSTSVKSHDYLWRCTFRSSAIRIACHLQGVFMFLIPFGAIQRKTEAYKFKHLPRLTQCTETNAYRTVPCPWDPGHRQLSHYATSILHLGSKLHAQTKYTSHTANPEFSSPCACMWAHTCAHTWS